MRFLRWLLGLIIFIIIFGFIWLVLRADLFVKFSLGLLVCFGLSLYRILRGPSSADRAVATDILGILVIGFCALLVIFTNKEWYMDIAIAWALQSFIAVLALAKFLEGRNFDE